MNRTRDPDTDSEELDGDDWAGPDRPASWRRCAVVVSVVLAVGVIVTLSWLSVRAATDRLDSDEYDAAVALEGGVRPMVTDRAGDLGTVTAVTVKRTPDPDPARVHLLAPIGEERAWLSVVSEAAPGDVVVEGRVDGMVDGALDGVVDGMLDGVLADGRPYEIFRDAGRYVSLATVGTDGQHLEVTGRDLSFDELLHHSAEVEVGHAGVVRLPDGWVELGDLPMPPWHDGVGTYYDFADGRRLGVTVERAQPGREALIAFADTEPVDLGTGEWAYRRLAPWAGLLFRNGDVVVDLTGEFTEAEFVDIAHSLREMRPDEHPVGEPDPYPS